MFSYLYTNSNGTEYIQDYGLGPYNFEQWFGMLWWLLGTDFNVCQKLKQR